MSSTSRGLTGRGGFARFGAGFFFPAKSAADAVIFEARPLRSCEVFGFVERFAMGV